MLGGLAAEHDAQPVPRPGHGQARLETEREPGSTRPAAARAASGDPTSGSPARPRPPPSARPRSGRTACSAAGVRQSVRKTIAERGDAPRPAAAAAPGAAPGRNSRKTGPNWCEKLSKRSGWSVIGPSAVSRFQGVDRHRPLDRVEHLVEPRPAEDLAEERIDRVARVRRRRGDTSIPRPIARTRNACQRTRSELSLGTCRPKAAQIANGQAERAAIAIPSSPASTSAGYFTPMASPASTPAGAARAPGGRSWTGQATSAAVPKAASATSFSGALMPLETAGTSSAIAPAHQARRPGSAAPAPSRSPRRPVPAPTEPAGTPPARGTPGPRRRASRSGADRPSHAGRGRRPTALARGRPWAPAGGSRARRRR